MRIIVVAPASPSEQDGLQVSRWVAGQAVTALEVQGFRVDGLLDERATRAGLLSALECSAEGLAAFSHGTPQALHGPPGAGSTELLVCADLDRMSGGWIYAFACRAGEGLGVEALEAGVRCFAGYRGALHVDWDPHTLPNELADLLRVFVVQTVLALARGDWELRRIQRELSLLADEIFRVVDDHLDFEGDASDPRGVRWIQATVQQMVSNLVIHVAT